MTTLEFFYDISCPYAYLGSTRIDALAKSASVVPNYEPFLLGGVFKALGDGAPDMTRYAASRARLNVLDMRRWAEHWGVPLNMPATHPNRTVLALRAALASSDVWRASQALFKAYWVEAKNVSEPDVVAAALSGAGFDGAELVRRADNPAIKDDLRARTDRAISRGVFGAPAVFVDGALYWGQDRFDFVADALGAPQTALSGAPFEPGPKPQRFELFYDFSSPFAYLATTQAEALAQRTGATLEWRPFLLGALFKAIGTADVPIATFSDQKRAFIRADLDRFAARYGVPFRFPSHFPIRSILPLRVALAAESDIAPVSHALMRAAWAEDRDISDAEVVRAVLRDAGFDPALVDRAASDPIKQKLKDATTEAETRGLCGAPSFVVGDLVFWGQDRMPFVEKALSGWRPACG